MHKQVDILIADDHALVRRGLKQVLESQPHFDIVEAQDGREALKLIREHQPRIAILDFEMPKMTGFEVAEQVQTEGLAIDIIFLTMHKDEAVFNKAMDVGAKGYVLKENTIIEIVQCIESVLEGNHYLSPAISEFLIRRSTKSSSPAANKDKIKLLTEAERNLLKQVAEIKTNQEIAVDLHISIKTVKNHRNNICNKMDISGTHALLKFAVEHASRL